VAGWPHPSPPEESRREAPSVAVVGRADAITAFRAVGLDVFAAEPGSDAVARVERLVADGYRVVFFTSELFGSLAPLLDRYRKSAVPCLVALPEGGGTESVARLRAAVRKAVGADVFAERSV